MVSSSNIKYAEESMETDAVECVKQRKRKHLNDDDSNDSTDGSSANDLEANNRIRFEKHLPYVKHVITECELRRRKSIKRRRLHLELEEFSDEEDMYDPDDEWSSSSITIVSNSSDTMYNENEYEVDPPEDPIELAEQEERIYIGSWLILSFVEGGWRYEQVKNFLREKYEVKCIKSKIVSERLAIQENNQNFYQAIVRFDTKKKLNLVIGDLIKRKIDDKFMFVSVDKLPLASSCEEWCEGDRFNAWLRILNEV